MKMKNVKMKNVKMKLVSIVSVFLANVSIASAGVANHISEPSMLSLIAIVSAIGVIAYKRNKK
jgi:hypothetical protein